MIWIDDPVVMDAVRRLAEDMKCSDEEAIRHALASELGIRRKAACEAVIAATPDNLVGGNPTSVADQPARP